MEQVWHNAFDDKPQAYQRKYNARRNTSIARGVLCQAGTDPISSNHSQESEQQGLTDNRNQYDRNRQI